MTRSLRVAVLSSLSAAVVAGCAEGPVRVDPAVVARHRASFVLDEEPAGAVTPLDWRDAAAPGDEPGVSDEEPAETAATASSRSGSAAAGAVVLVGQIGGMPNPWGDAEPDYPWRASTATFFLVDPSTAAEFDDHLGDAGEDHAANCAFCAREAAKKSSSIAAVSFADDAGEPIAIDARRLFDLAAGDVVVVRGTPRDTTGDLLVLDADGIFVRR